MNDHRFVLACPLPACHGIMEARSKQSAVALMLGHMAAAHPELASRYTAARWATAAYLAAHNARIAMVAASDLESKPWPVGQGEKGRL